MNLKQTNLKMNISDRGIQDFTVIFHYSWTPAGRAADTSDPNVCLLRDGIPSHGAGFPVLPLPARQLASSPLSLDLLSQVCVCLKVCPLREVDSLTS